MNNLLKKSAIIFSGIAMISTLLVLSSCEKDDNSEYASCGSMTCSTSEPYSNEYASGCYATQSDCESATGHTCKNCN